jgi:hypothetical protein
VQQQKQEDASPNDNAKMDQNVIEAFFVTTITTDS